jgi:hypothetical protein
VLASDIIESLGVRKETLFLSVRTNIISFRGKLNFKRGNLDRKYNNLKDNLSNWRKNWGTEKFPNISQIVLHRQVPIVFFHETSARLIIIHEFI